MRASVHHHLERIPNGEKWSVRSFWATHSWCIWKNQNCKRKHINIHQGSSIVSFASVGERSLCNKSLPSILYKSCFHDSIPWLTRRSNLSGCSKVQPERTNNQAHVYNSKKMRKQTWCLHHSKIWPESWQNFIYDPWTTCDYTMKLFITS